LLAHLAKLSAVPFFNGAQSLKQAAIGICSAFFGHVANPRYRLRIEETCVFEELSVSLNAGRKN
jgi:hypothetical protein